MHRFSDLNLAERLAIGEYSFNLLNAFYCNQSVSIDCRFNLDYLGIEYNRGLWGHMKILRRLRLQCLQVGFHSNRADNLRLDIINGAVLGSGQYRNHFRDGHRLNWSCRSTSCHHSDKHEYRSGQQHDCGLFRALQLSGLAGRLL